MWFSGAIELLPQKPNGKIILLSQSKSCTKLKKKKNNKTK